MDETRPLRTFIALVPDAAALDQLARQMRKARRSNPWTRNLRWIPAENLHLTLRFLGSTEADTVRDIIAELPHALSVEPFSYHIDRLALFPTPRRPRLIAAQLAESAPMRRLAADLERLAQRHGFAPETRGFRAHLTLARARGNFPQRAALDHEFAPIEALASEITYFASETQPTGAVYTPLARVPLPGSS